MNARYAIPVLLSFVFLLIGPATASFGASSTTPLPSGTLESLAENFRGFLVANMPSPLFESNQGWGNKKKFKEIKWSGKGLKTHAKVVQVDKNDGIWKRMQVTAWNPQQNLTFDLRNLQQTSSGAATFDAFLSFDARAEYDRQNWQSGVRLYSGSTRARFRIKLVLKCEVTSRLEKGDSFVPDMVFRLRVLQANAGYDNFVCEHVAGMGGEMAEAIGEAARGGLRLFHPGLEKDMLAKANAAIVKAADTKEVRISLGKLLGQ